MTAAPNPYQRAGAAYRANAVETASPGRLVVMLYDGILAAIGTAESAIEEKNHDVAHRELTRAQAIVTELQLSLDHEVGGDIARSLDGIYGYWLAELTRANVRKDAAPLGPLKSQAASLRSAWAEAAETLV